MALLPPHASPHASDDPPPIGDRLKELLARGDPPLETLAALAPLLLCASAQNGFDSTLALVQPLVRELLCQARGAGDVAEAIDRDRAAELFVALVLGQIRVGPPGESGSSPEALGRELAAFFRAALRGGEPARHARRDEPKSALTPLLALDARPILAGGRDPLAEILQSLERVAPGGLLLLTVPFRPGPLLRLLGGGRREIECREVAPGHFEVEILQGRLEEGARIHDFRGLPAPEPLEQVLLQSAGLAPGEFLLARLPRSPKPLLPLLEGRGFRWILEELQDGTAILAVWISS